MQISKVNSLPYPTSVAFTLEIYGKYISIFQRIISFSNYCPVKCSVLYLSGIIESERRMHFDFAL